MHRPEKTLSPIPDFLRRPNMIPATALTGTVESSSRQTSWFHLFTYKRFHVLLNSLFKVLCNFRSPVTTLSPPLRGLGSRPAPSLPRRRVFAYPFDSGSSARFGFEAETGRILSPEPVVRADLRRSCDDFRSPLPFRSLNPPDRPLRVFQPARRATRSIGFITTSSPRPTLDSFLLLATLLFRLALRIKTRNPPSSFPVETYINSCSLRVLHCRN